MDLASVERYLEHLVMPSDPILQEMDAMAKERHFPYVGPLVGQLLMVLATSIQATRVLELGSGFGYSAWWFSQAVGPDGEVHLTERDPQNLALANDFLTRSGFADRIYLHSGEASQALVNIPGDFDVVFIDARKVEYPAFLDAAVSRVRVGGYIIADNTLWGGAVAHPASESDLDTRALQEFNRKIFRETRLRSMILPLRDGVSISLKLE